MLTNDELLSLSEELHGKTENKIINQAKDMKHKLENRRMNLYSNNLDKNQNEEVPRIKEFFIHNYIPVDQLDGDDHIDGRILEAARQRRHEHWQKNLILKADPEIENQYKFREDMFSPDEVRHYIDMGVKTYKHRDATGQDIYLYKRDRKSVV